MLFRSGGGENTGLVVSTTEKVVVVDADLPQASVTVKVTIDEEHPCGAVTKELVQTNAEAGEQASLA